MTEFFASYSLWIIWIILGVVFLILMVSAPCHAVFLLPFAGLPLFWLLPLGYALPINVVAWVATPFLYRMIRRAMRKPVQDGFRSLIGTGAEVVSRQAVGHSVTYLVRARGEGELWSARSTDTLDIGDWVNIVAVRGIGVVVARSAPGSLPDETENAKGENNGNCEGPGVRHGN
jgi:membrane protein implicated in regulation of membrane protease activity